MEKIDIDKLFKDMEEDNLKHANSLYKKYGQFKEKYKELRIGNFTVGRKFKFDKLKYEVIEADIPNNLVTFKRLGFTFRKAPSGRKLKRYGKFGLTSTMDFRLRFIGGE